MFLVEVLRSLKSKGEPRLEDMCRTSTIVGFGRALWYSYHRQWVPGRENRVLNMAKLKLVGVDPQDPFQSQIVALSIQIGVNFDSMRQVVRAMESKLVECHLPVVHVIPERQEYIIAGTHSEPILANAAAEYLDECSEGQGIATLAPKALATAVTEDLLARGEAEASRLCGRTILTVTCAHTTQPSTNSPTEPVVHYYIESRVFISQSQS